MEIDPPDTLFGLYQGTPLTERRWGYGNALPDRILLFQGPHEREAEDHDDLIVLDRRNADPRDRPLLRPERRGDRGDRRALLARPCERGRGRGRGRDVSRPPALETRRGAHRARKRFGQHFLERAWVEKVLRGDRAGPRRCVPRDRSRGRRAHPCHWPPPPGTSSRSRSTATSPPPCAGGGRADRDRRRGRLPRRHAGNSCVRSSARIGVDDGPLRVAGQSSLQRRLANPLQVRRPVSRRGSRLRDAVLMLQREVADRLLASPGTRDYGVLSVLLRHVADIDRLLALPPGAFRPPPAVQSSLVRLRFHAAAPPARDDLAVFRGLDPGRVHQAAEDAGQCARRLFSCCRHACGRASLQRRHRWPPSARNAGHPGVRAVGRRGRRRRQPAKTLSAGFPAMLRFPC